VRELTAVIVGLVWCQIAIFLTTVYLHRTLSHRAVKMSPPLRFACRLLIWLTTGIQPRQWAAVHRKHHAYTDVEGDPHSPLIDGFATVQFGNAWLYRKVAMDPDTVARYAKDLPPDRWDKVLFKHGVLGLAAGYGVLTLILGWKMALLALAVHIPTYLLLNAAVNAVGHSYGRRNYPGLATNNQWLAFLVAGEGLHSNHHAAPTSARLSFRRGELDPGWWAISVARHLHLLTVRHDRPKFTAQAAHTPELV
jgi:stearoyl-CoA desaturase (delta-9 desaturase)